MATHPTVLGLTLDPKLTYSTHIHNISIQVHKMIKALTATGWGKQKEALMATYKAVMIPALVYASSIWSPIASSTIINKLVMQNAALRTATGCTQDTIILHLHAENSYFSCTTTYSSTPHNTNRKYNIHHIPYTNIQHNSTLQGSKSKFHYIQQRPLHNKHSHTVTTTDIKTNMCHIHTYIYCLNASSHKKAITHHVVTPGFLDRPSRSDCTAGQMGGEAGWWTTSGKIRLPPLARVKGVGRQQQTNR